MRTMMRKMLVSDVVPFTDVVTHDGAFHADEAMAVAILSHCIGKPTSRLAVMRASDQEKIQEAASTGAIVVDVGGVYDPDQGRFDHHQRDFSEVRPDGTKYSSAGLVWRQYGTQVFENTFWCMSGHEEEAAEIVDRILIRGIDAGDNGMYALDGSWSLYNLIGSCNPSFREYHSGDPHLPNSFVSGNELFVEACELASYMLWRACERACSILYGRHEVAKAMNRAIADGSVIMELSVFIEGWKEAVIQNEAGAEILFGVYEDTLRHQWVVMTVPPALDRMSEQRKPLPEAWRGKAAAELQETTGVQDAMFCHVSGFMCAAKSREGALQLAELAAEA